MVKNHDSTVMIDDWSTNDGWWWQVVIIDGYIGDEYWWWRFIQVLLWMVKWLLMVNSHGWLIYGEWGLLEMSHNDAKIVMVNSDGEILNDGEWWWWMIADNDE